MAGKKKNKGNKNEAKHRMGKVSGKPQASLGGKKIGKVTGSPQTGLGRYTTPGAGSVAPGPGMIFVPGSPGVRNDPVAPFMSAADISEDADRQAGWDSELSSIQSGLDKLGAETNFQLGQLDKQRAQDLESSADNMASRGLFQSSIKDADLYDIEATSRLRKEFVDTQLKNAVLDAGNQRKIIQDNRDAWAKALNQRMVDNAAGVNADQPIWKQAPTEGHWQPQTQPMPPSLAAPAGHGTAQSGTPQPNMASGQGQLKSEAQQRIGGKKGGRGKVVGRVTGTQRTGLGTVTGTVSQGSAGIR